MYPEAGDSVESLIQSADIAMYHVKGRGKNGYQFFSDEMNHKFSTRLSLERELRSALATGQLRVYYQPQVDLTDGRIIGVEALVRWQHPRHGLIEPAEFLSVAEETGLITQLDEWVQVHAFERSRASGARTGRGDVRLSVNMSSQQLEQDAFLERFLANLDASGLRGRTPEDRDHRERDHARHGSDRAEAARAAKSRHPHCDRRFRHRLFVARRICSISR